MAKTVTVTVRVKSVGDGKDHTDIFTFTNANAPGAAYDVKSAGDNGFGPAVFLDGVFTGVVLVPPNSQSGTPSQSGISKTLKGVAGDTGIPLDPAGVQVIPSTSAFIVNYSSAEGAESVFF